MTAAVLKMAVAVTTVIVSTAAVVAGVVLEVVLCEGSETERGGKMWEGRKNGRRGTHSLWLVGRCRRSRDDMHYVLLNVCCVIMVVWCSGLRCMLVGCSENLRSTLDQCIYFSLL